MASDFDIHIGTRMGYGGSEIPFGLNVSDLYQHAWINGQTGQGKSELTRSILAQVIAAGHGCTLIDFNGDLANKILNNIPMSRRNDVVYLDLADTEHVLSLNFFYQVPPDRRAVTALDFTDATKRIFVDSWGERMDWILYNIVAAILDAPDELKPTLLSIGAFLDIPHYRNAIIKNIQDPSVARFFQHEWPNHLKSRNDETLSPIRNKIGKITANPYVRNLLSLHKPSFQIRDAISKRSIVIVRLSKSILGKRPAGMIGSLAVSTLLNAAQEQDTITADRERTPHFLFIDELRHLTSDVLADAFSEHRHYNFGIVATTQYTDQIREINENLLNSMFGNIATVLAFRSSNTDAKHFEHQIGEFPADHYINLRRGEIRGRLLSDENTVRQIRAKTEIGHLLPHNHGEKIRSFVRQRYTRSRSEVESLYARWLRKQMIDPAERKAQRQQFTERRVARNKIKYIIPQDPRGTVTCQPLIDEQRATSNPSSARAPDRHALMKKPTRRKRRHSKA